MNATHVQVDMIYLQPIYTVNSIELLLVYDLIIIRKQ